MKNSNYPDGAFLGYFNFRINNKEPRFLMPLSELDGNVSPGLSGDEEGRELRLDSGLALSRGQAGCNLHSAHLREQQEKKPLPPSRKPAVPCGRECQLSYKNGSVAITRSHLSLAAFPPSQSHWRSSGKKKKAVSGKWWPHKPSPLGFFMSKH